MNAFVHELHSGMALRLRTSFRELEHETYFGMVQSPTPTAVFRPIRRLQMLAEALLRWRVPRLRLHGRAGPIQSYRVQMEALHLCRLPAARPVMAASHK